MEQLCLTPLTSLKTLREYSSGEQTNGLWVSKREPLGLSASVSCCKDNVSVEYLKRASKSVRA